MSSTRTPDPAEVSDDCGAFVAPYLGLWAEDAGPRRSPRRAVFTGLR